LVEVIASQQQIVVSVADQRVGAIAALSPFKVKQRIVADSKTRYRAVA
jgi:hypothetical protein